jgi:hypothetical protein
MKKIYLSLMAAAAISTVSAQKPVATITEYAIGERIFENSTNSAQKINANVPIIDTVDYYFWKQFLKKSTAPYNSFGTFSISPTHTNIVVSSSFGSIFRNTGTQVVTGADVLTRVPSNSAETSVTLRLDVYNAPGGVPAGASLANCTTVVTGTAGTYYGCNFATPAIVSNEYVITLTPVTTNSLAGVSVFLTSANQPTSAATENKFGEGNGFIRTAAGQWFSLTGVFTPTAQTDAEPVVAARVGYSVTADHASTTMTTCNTVGVNYPNTSSSWFTNRQFNMNQFVKYWAPFTNPQYTVQANSADSIFTWNFGDNTTEYVTSPSHTYIAIGTNTVVNDQLIAKHMKMSGSRVKNLDVKTWTVSVTVCNVGLTENSLESKMAVYPNPATDKVVVYLNDANSNTQIQVLNALGQVVYTKNNVSDVNEISTSGLAQGVYFVRVTKGKEVATSKLVINN